MLWPAHPKLQQDEMLSSWIVRLARANGMPTRVFWRVINSDHALRFATVDRRLSEPLFRVLSEGTGVPIAEIRQACNVNDAYDADFPQISNRRLGQQARSLRTCAHCFAEEQEP